MIALANPSATEALSYSVYLQYKGGSYTWDGGGRLQPGEVKHVAIRRLRDGQIEGENGALLPPEVLAGQAKAVVHNGRGERNKLVGEAIQIDGQGRMTGFLSCPYCPPDPSYVTLFPLSLTGNVGTSQQIYPTIHWADGTSFINQNPWAIDWYPGNSSVATVSEAWSNFQVQFQGPGSTQMDAKMPNECHYEWNHFVSECDCPYYPVAAAQVPTSVTSKLEFKITTRAFIMPNHAGWDGLTCAADGGVYFKGDERGFSSSSGKFRTQNKVTYRSDPGGSVVSYSRGVGQSRSYAKDAIDNNGRIGPEDEDGMSDDCTLWHKSGFAGKGNMHASKSSANGVRINGGASNPLVLFSPDIDWDYTINFGVANPSAPTYSLTVTHDCYPAHEAYIGNQTVYTFAPSSNSTGHIYNCLMGLGKVVNVIRSGVVAQ